MSSSQELSNIYGSNTNLVEVQTSFVIEWYNKLRDAVYDLEQDLNNLDVSNATEFICELAKILTSNLTESKPAPEVIQVNLPFTQAQLLRLTRNAFASLLCDRRFNKQAQNQIGEIHGSIAEIINSLFNNIPQSEPVKVVNPTQDAERLYQMFAKSNRYGIVSLADVRAVINGLLDADVTNSNLAGDQCGKSLHDLIEVLLDHIEPHVVECEGDLNNFLESEDEGYVTMSIPCNRHELMMMVVRGFNNLIETMQPTNREMAQIRTLEASFKEVISNFHDCLTANEIKAYASIC